ncbi:WD40 repeat domain-containing protein [Embleya sp. NPDC001921]
MAHRELWAVGPRRDELASFDSGAEAVEALCVLRLAEGTRVACGTSDGLIRLWDPTAGEETLVLGGLRSRVSALSALPVDGETVLAAGGPDAAVQLWNPRTGELLRTLSGHGGRVVNGLCPVPFDGCVLLASGGDDGTVRLWDPTTGRLLRSLAAHTQPYDGTYPVRGLCAFGFGDRTVLAGGSDDGTIRLWDAATGSLLNELAGRPDPYRDSDAFPHPLATTVEGHTGPVNALCALSIAGRTVLVSGGDKVLLWDPATGRLLRTLDGVRLTFGLCPVQLGDRTALATAGGGNNAVQVWDANTGERLRTLQGHTGPVWGGVCPLPEAGGRTLLASGGGKFDGMVRLWDPTRPSAVDSGPPDDLESICTLPLGDRTLVASGANNGAVRLWDAELGTRTDVLNREEIHFTRDWVGGVCAVSVEDRTLLAVASHNRTIRLHDPVAGEEVRMIGYLWDPARPDRPETDAHARGFADWIVADEFAAVCPVPSGGRQLLATCGESGQDHMTHVRLWDPATGEQLRTVARHKGRLEAMCALPLADRTLLACAGRDTCVWLWDITSDEHPKPLVGHRGWVNAVCGVPVGDRTLLASGSHDGTVRLWDPATGRRVRVLTGHREWVRGLCLLPLGGRTLLASGSKDRTVRLWDLDEFRCVAEIAVRSPVAALAAAENRLFVASGAGVHAYAVGADGVIGDGPAASDTEPGAAMESRSWPRVPR